MKAPFEKEQQTLIRHSHIFSMDVCHVHLTGNGSELDSILIGVYEIIYELFICRK